MELSKLTHIVLIILSTPKILKVLQIRLHLKLESDRFVMPKRYLIFINTDLGIDQFNSIIVSTDPISNPE